MKDWLRDGAKRNGKRGDDKQRQAPFAVQLSAHTINAFHTRKILISAGEAEQHNSAG